MRRSITSKFTWGLANRATSNRDTSLWTIYLKSWYYSREHLSKCHNWTDLLMKECCNLHQSLYLQTRSADHYIRWNLGWLIHNQRTLLRYTMDRLSIDIANMCLDVQMQACTNMLPQPARKKSLVNHQKIWVLCFSCSPTSTKWIYTKNLFISKSTMKRHQKSYLLWFSYVYWMCMFFDSYLNTSVLPIVFTIESGVVDKILRRSPISLNHVFMVFVLWSPPNHTPTKYI